jgi:hypothetical protein
MLFRYGSGQQQINSNKIQANCWQFRLPWQCSGTTQGTSPDRAHRGLHSKPLDAAIDQLPVLYCPIGHHG